jgi:hypothetical protein
MVEIVEGKQRGARHIGWLGQLFVAPAAVLLMQLA